MGCGGPQPGAKDPNATAASEGKEPPKTLKVSSGEATQSSGGAKPEKLWSVKWKDAELQLQGQDPLEGKMEGVSGRLYQRDKPVSDYSAQGAIADREKNLLSLSGKVRVESLTDPAAVLTCDEMIWDAAAKVIRARGHVKIESDVGTLVSKGELWASPDLKTVGTPSLFKKAR